MPDETWQRLAERVKGRRYDLRLTQTMLAREAGTSDRTIGAMERAEQTTYQASTLRSIAIALGWTPDSIDRILAGLEPVDAAVPLDKAPIDLRAEVQRLRVDVDRLQAEVAELRRVHLVDLDDPDEARIWGLPLSEGERWREVQRLREAKAAARDVS